MLSTFLVISLALGLFVGSLVLWGVFLGVGLRWVKVQDVSTRRIVFVVLLVIVLQWTLVAVLYLVWPAGRAPALALAVVEPVLAVLIPCLVIMRVFKSSFLRSLQATVPPHLTSVGMVVFILVVLRPFLFEAFVASGNSMAPTLLGSHWQSTCSECGSPAYCSPIPESLASSRDAPLMICQDHFHITQPTDHGDRVHGPDRFLVAKFVRPQRWDIVAFRYPEDPSIRFVSCLVGLPGEEITIKDGRVRANGKPLTPPDSLRGIEYTTEIDHWSRLWGTPDRPAKLASDEYFVLGDLSPQSKDSRMWEDVPPGHHPFAVPETHMIGVATNIYWPPSRWRAFR